MEDVGRSIIQVDRLEENFTIISNSLLQDPEISMDSQAIGTYILSLPKYKKDGTPWEIYPRHIWNSKNIGRNRVYNAINELCHLGYMKKTVEKRGNLNSKTTYLMSSLKKFLRDPGIGDVENRNPTARDYKKKESYKVLKETTNTKPPASSPPPPSEGCSSLKSSLLEKTKLSSPQKMRILDTFLHLEDSVFENAIEAFLVYSEKYSVGNQMATITKALGGSGGEPWVKSVSEEDREEKNRDLTKKVLGEFDGKLCGNKVKYKVDIYNKFIEFSLGSYCKLFDFNKIEYMPLVNSFLKKLGLTLHLQH